jgi:hypothetical protein
MCLDLDEPIGDRLAIDADISADDLDLTAVGRVSYEHSLHLLYPPRVNSTARRKAILAPCYLACAKWNSVIDAASYPRLPSHTAT